MTSSRPPGRRGLQSGRERPLPADLGARIRAWGRDLGFQRIGFSGIELGADERRLGAWLEAGHHGGMDYMARHGSRRSRPAELIAGTRSVICARIDYLPASALPAQAVLADPLAGYLARYALGRDYHKVVRRRLQRLCARIEEAIGPFRYRVFADSAPVLEKPLARNAGLGWIGKHTNLIAREAGSWFFLGEVYTDLPLGSERPEADRCGTCRACIEACPSGAIIAPYRLDARRCISYLTIEHHGPIPEPLRAPIGNRVFGCDDCQLVCPWNRFARPSAEPDFAPRWRLDGERLSALFAWSELEFARRTEGSVLRRLGHLRWLRNLAVALGNAPPDRQVIASLEARRSHPSALVREHVAWALARHAAANPVPLPSPAAQRSEQA